MFVNCPSSGGCRSEAAPRTLSVFKTDWHTVQSGFCVKRSRAWSADPVPDMTFPFVCIRNKLVIFVHFNISIIGITIGIWQELCITNEMLNVNALFHFVPENHS